MRVCDTLSTSFRLFFCRKRGRERQQVRWFVRVLDKWSVEKTSDVVLEARPWPRGASRPIFMVLALALASGPMALASKVQALALRAALTMSIVVTHDMSPDGQVM